MNVHFELALFVLFRGYSRPVQWWRSGYDSDVDPDGAERIRTHRYQRQLLELLYWEDTKTAQGLGLSLYVTYDATYDQSVTWYLLYLNPLLIRKYDCHPLCPPGRLVFLPSRVHIADTCTEVSGSGELYSHRLVPPLASARPAVCQLHFHRENTWTGGDSTFTNQISTLSFPCLLISSALWEFKNRNLYLKWGNNVEK